MEAESGNLQDVAEPDALVSGAAGTGQKNGNGTGTGGTTGDRCLPVPQKLGRVATGPDVLHNRKIQPSPEIDAMPHPGTDAGGAESVADLAIFLFERDERVRDQLQKKIDRLDCRITKLEDRRRS